MTVGGLGTKPPPYEHLDEASTPTEAPKDATPQVQAQVIAQPDLSAAAAEARQFRRLSAFKRLVAIELAAAVAFVLLGAIVVGTASAYSYHGFYFRRYPNTVGAGIWGGIFACLAGAFGVAAGAKPRNRCLLMTYFVLAIIAVALFVPIILSFAAVGVDIERSSLRRAGYQHANWERNRGRTSTTPSYNFNYDDQLSDDEYAYIAPDIKGTLAAQALLIMLCLLHAGVTIGSLALVCFNWGKGFGGCCHCCGEAEAAGGGGPIVVYVAAGTDPAHIQNAINAVRSPQA